MIKKYLTTPEEILALKDTDTKIYIENNRGYFKYVNDIVCYFEDDYCYFNAEIMFGPCYEKKYILVEEPVREVIGKIGWFWDDDETRRVFGRVVAFNECGSHLFETDNSIYKHFRPLTPEEVAEITDYKVEVK